MKHKRDQIVMDHPPIDTPTEPGDPALIRDAATRNMAAMMGAAILKEDGHTISGRIPDLAVDALYGAKALDDLIRMDERKKEKPKLNAREAEIHEKLELLNKGSE